jgi:hypothetical protein
MGHPFSWCWLAKSVAGSSLLPSVACRMTKLWFWWWHVAFGIIFVCEVRVGAGLDG